MAQNEVTFAGCGGHMGELYFDCLRCGAITPILDRRKCTKCGSGVGAVAKSREGAFRRPTEEIEKSALSRPGVNEARAPR